MCGRTSLAVAPEVIEQETRAQRWENAHLYRPSHNVPPTRYQPVLLRLRGGAGAQGPAADGQEAAGDLFLCCMKWGLVPPWKTATAPVVNARDDSLTGNKPMFSRLKQHKRCAVVAQGYFEWQRKQKDKQPYFVSRTDGKLMLLAGLYDEVEVGGERVKTYTIVTTSAPPAMQFLHDRMPVRLDHDENALKTWLDPSIGWTPEVASVLTAVDDGLQQYPVPHAVGKVGNDGPELVEPLKEKKPDATASKTKDIASFFQRKSPKAEGATTARSKRKGQENDGGLPQEEKSGERATGGRPGEERKGEKRLHPAAGVEPPTPLPPTAASPATKPAKGEAGAAPGEERKEEKRLHPAAGGEPPTAVSPSGAPRKRAKVDRGGTRTPGRPRSKVKT